MTDLQADVATAADYAGAHATAPALLLQAQASLGRLAELTTEATENGRRPYRIPHGWDSELARLAYLVYLIADQTEVSIDGGVREITREVRNESADRRSRLQAQNDHWL